MSPASSSPFFMVLGDSVRLREKNIWSIIQLVFQMTPRWCVLAEEFITYLHLAIFDWNPFFCCRVSPCLCIFLRSAKRPVRAYDPVAWNNWPKRILVESICNCAVGFGSTYFLCYSFVCAYFSLWNSKSGNQHVSFKLRLVLQSLNNLFLSFNWFQIQQIFSRKGSYRFVQT